MDCPCKTCKKSKEEQKKCKMEGMTAYCGKYGLWDKAIGRIAYEVTHPERKPY